MAFLKILCWTLIFLIRLLSKTINGTRSTESSYFIVFKKLIRGCYLQIALETKLLSILTEKLTLLTI